MVNNITVQGLSQFIGTEKHYRHPLCRGVLYTDGIRYLIENGAAWLADAVASHLACTPDLAEKCGGTLFFTLTVNEDNTAVLVGCVDKGKPPLVEQSIEYTDFPLKEQSIWASIGGDNGEWVMHLPSEY